MTNTTTDDNITPFLDFLVSPEFLVFGWLNTTVEWLGYGLVLSFVAFLIAGLKQGYPSFKQIQKVNENPETQTLATGLGSLWVGCLSFLFLIYLSAGVIWVFITSTTMLATFLSALFVMGAG